jgi:hypothetical protein
MFVTTYNFESLRVRHYTPRKQKDRQKFVNSAINGLAVSRSAALNMLTADI